MFKKKKKKKKGGGQHLKKKRGGSNIGSCPQVPVGNTCNFSQHKQRRMYQFIIT